MTTYSLLFSRKDLDRKIAELEKKTYLPPALVSLVSDVSGLLLEMAPEVQFPDAPDGLPKDVFENMPTGSARRQGVVILPRELFPLDMNVARAMAKKVIASLTANAPEVAPVAKELSDAFENGSYDLDLACRQLLSQAGAPQSVSGTDHVETQVGDENLCLFDAWAASHEKSPSLLRFVVQCAVMPSALAVSSRLASYHDASNAWLHGHCPVCGSLPFMGRLKGQEGMRMHACSFCGFEYRAPRMGCPFCLEDLSGKAEFTVCEDDPAYQLHICTACNHYIKIADFREYDRPYIPMLDDLASLLLDLHAEQMGLIRPTLSAWGF